MTTPELSGADLVPPPTAGRLFTTQRRVSIDDCDPGGRMELDAVFRFLQDAGNDDTDDAGLPKLGLAWIARKAVIVVMTAPTARELVDISTWCSGTGSRWAERRTRIVGPTGAHIDAATVWVHVDPTSGRPIRWGEEFASTYLEAAGGREVDSRLHHDKVPPGPGADGVERAPWSFRRTDLDAFGHVNNAAYLAVLEEVFDPVETASSHVVEIEWRRPSLAGEPLTIVTRRLEQGLDVWLVAGDDLRVTMRHRPVTD